MPPTYQHFSHDADMGLRGLGHTKAEAFKQLALALTAVVTDPEKVKAVQSVSFECRGNDDELLIVDGLNRLIYEMSTRDLLFGRFEVSWEGDKLSVVAYGEPVDVLRHAPAVEVKGATYTALKLFEKEGVWTAEVVVDV